VTQSELRQAVHAHLPATRIGPIRVVTMAAEDRDVPCICGCGRYSCTTEFAVKIKGKEHPVIVCNNTGKAFWGHLPDQAEFGAGQWPESARIV
jgi:hypothetical protein